MDTLKYVILWYLFHYIIFYFYLFFNFLTFAAVYPSGCPSSLPPFFPAQKVEILEYGLAKSRRGIGTLRASKVSKVS